MRRRLRLQLACAVGWLAVLGAAAPAHATRVAPTVAIAQSQSFRNVARPSFTMTYSTPAYTSMDAQRSVTLFYASGQAYPVGYVSVDATDASTEAPVKMSITVMSTSGSAVSSETFYSARNGVNRLSAYFSAVGVTTGTYTYNLRVRTYWSDGTYSEAPLQSVRVLLLNEGGSRFGTGWSIMGLHRLYVQNGTGGVYGVTIAQGDGTVRFFERTCPSCGTFTSPQGDFSTLVLNADGTYTRMYPGGGAAMYSATGVIQWMRDNMGNYVNYAWTTLADGTPIPTSITDPAGKATQLGYYTSQFLSTITDPAGRASTLGYTGASLTTVVDPTGTNAFQATYSNQFITSYKDRGLNQWDVWYDAPGYTTLALLQAPTVTLSTGTATRPATYVTSWEAAQLPPLNTGTTSAPAPYVNPDSVRLKVTDPRGYVTRAKLDALALPVRVEDPLGGVTTYQRNTAGQPTRIQNPAGAAQTNTWDTQGRLTLTASYLATGHLARSMKVNYNSACPYQPDSAVVTDSLVSTVVKTSYTYTTACLLYKQWNGTASASADLFSYDTHGRVTTATSAAGAVTTYFRDGNAWMNTDSVRTVATDGAGVTQKQTDRWRYDGYGRVSRSQNALGDTTVTEYDLLNRVTGNVDAYGRRTKLLYGAMFVDSLVDAAGKTYAYTRNALGWATTERTPGVTRSYGYDVGGNLAQTGDPGYGTVTMTYDPIGRLLTETADGTTTTYGYDNPGNRWVSVANAESTDTLNYDEQGRLSSAVSRMGGKRYQRNYLVNEVGQLSSVRMDTPGSAFNFYTAYLYDGAMRLWDVMNVSGEQTQYSYSSTTGLLSYRRTWSGAQFTYAYDTFGRATQRTVTDAAGTVLGTLNSAFGQKYSYDNLNRLTSVKNTVPDVSRGFRYDQMGQLNIWADSAKVTQRTCDPDNPRICFTQTVWTEQDFNNYGYDAVGNRSTATLVPGTNRYQSFNGYTLEHDGAGNVTRRYNGTSNQTFTWNSRGQLASVTNGSGTVQYFYNGMGEMVRRVDVSTGVTTRYLRDRGRLWVEMDGSGNPLRGYHYSPGGEPVMMDAWNGSTWTRYDYATDPSGNVMGLYSGTSQVVNQYKYKPFGEQSSATEGVANSLRFASQQYDAKTGLYLMSARWYDPALQRFVSEDPIGIRGGINTYAYAGNDPVNFSDPTGYSAGATGGCTDTYFDIGPYGIGVNACRGGGTPAPPPPPPTGDEPPLPSCCKTNNDPHPTPSPAANRPGTQAARPPAATSHEKTFGECMNDAKGTLIGIAGGVITALTPLVKEAAGQRVPVLKAAAEAARNRFMQTGALRDLEGMWAATEEYAAAAGAAESAAYVAVGVGGFLAGYGIGAAMACGADHNSYSH